MNAAPEYRRLCKNGDQRTVIETMDICGPCFAEVALRDFRYKLRQSPARRGMCKHCGKDRQLNGRDLCESRCAKLDVAAHYPVVRGRGRRRQPDDLPHPHHNRS